jgi:glycosyltransferase involved in cell wall biosynthesis
MIPPLTENGSAAKVSIVLPTYNRSKLLPEALTAIRAQTYPNWQLIVIDDGRTDNTEELLNNWKTELGNRVRTVRQPNQGAYAARNTGIKLCKGDFIAFYDSDDRWHPHHLQACMDVFKEAPTVSWYTVHKEALTKRRGK